MSRWPNIKKKERQGFRLSQDIRGRKSDVRPFVPNVQLLLLIHYLCPLIKLGILNTMMETCQLLDCPMPVLWIFVAMWLKIIQMPHPRAKLYDNAKLLNFTEKLEATCIGTVESVKMTKDLALLIHGSKVTRDQYLNTEEFIDAVAEELKARL